MITSLDDPNLPSQDPDRVWSFLPVNTTEPPQLFMTLISVLISNNNSVTGSQFRFLVYFHFFFVYCYYLRPFVPKLFISSYFLTNVFTKPQHLTDKRSSNITSHLHSCHRILSTYNMSETLTSNLGGSLTWPGTPSRAICTPPWNYENLFKFKE